MVAPRVNHKDGLCPACRANVHERCTGAGMLNTGCVTKSVDCMCPQDHPKPERYKRPARTARQG